MKKIYLTCFALTVALSSVQFSASAQKDKVGSVGIGTNSPDQSAILDLNSNSKGLLMPRMSLEQRNGIQSPAKGLMIYQTDMLSGVYIYDGTEWKGMTGANSIAADPNDWTILGNSNAGLNHNTHYVGTSAASNVPLVFRVKGVRAGMIDIAEATAATGYAYTGTSSIFFGANAGNVNAGLNNIGIGTLAMNLNTTGKYNLAFGTQSMRKNTTGENNVAIGAFSMLENTTSSFNVAIGVSALQKNVAGGNNFALGYAALLNNVSGTNNVAIGSGAGQNNLGSNNLFIGKDAGRNETGSSKLYIANTNTSNPLIKGEFDNKNLKVNTGATVSSTVGFLAVGNFDAAYTMPASNSYRLIVQDGIITEKVKVALKSTADWADYVFEPSYKLMSLEKVEEFVKENKHLPNVPSAEDMSKNGLDVSQTSAKLMEKIEELTLYMIEMNKEIKALKAENEKLKNK